MIRGSARKRHLKAGHAKGAGAVTGAADPLYSLTPGGFARGFFGESFGFWMICGYLLVEYVRPQSIISGLDILPWAQICVLGTIAGLFADRSWKWVSDPANVYMTLFLVTLVLASIFAVYPSVSMEHWFDFFGWYAIYFLIINTVTTERRFFIFLSLFLLASFKLSLFGAKTWVMRGFAFTNWGIAGPPGPFQNSGELSIQMLMAAPIGLAFAHFVRPYVSQWKYYVLLLIPITSAMTVIGASSRGAQLGLVVQGVMGVLRSKKSVKVLIVASILGGFGYALMPQEQKGRFESMGEDQTSQQRLLYWKHGLDMIKDRPLLGVGFYNFAPYYQEHYPDDILFGRAQLPHNIFVQVGTDAGLIGLGLFLLIIYRNISCARQIRRLCNTEESRRSLPAVMSSGLMVAACGFVVAGQFVTVSYYPFIWINLAMSVALLNIAKKQAAIAPATR